MALFKNKSYTIPIIINDVINGVPVRRSQVYKGKVVDPRNTGVKCVVIEGWKDKEFKLPKSDEWVMTNTGRGLEINVYNPDHYTYVKQTMVNQELQKAEVDQESIGLAIVLDDVLKKYEEKPWWDTDIFRTSAILVIFLLIIMVSLFYMGNMTKDYTEALKGIDNKRHIEEMAWINATTNIQQMLKYNVNVMPSETAEVGS